MFKSKTTIFIQYVLFLLVGYFLVRHCFKNINLNELTEKLKSGNYYIAFPVLLISLLVYFFRIQRWNILLNSLEIPVKKNNQFIALSLCYLVNFAVPRFGEITRAIVLKRTDKVAINESLATIVFERTADLFCLGILTVVALFSETYQHSDVVIQFVKKASEINFPATILLLFFLCILVAIGILIKLLKKKNIVSLWISGFISSFKKLLKIKHISRFSFYTILIWFCYYLMTYLWFFTFTDSSSLSFYKAFQVMLIGTFARTIPVQAGSAGVYHNAVSYTLNLMGLSLITGNALAIIIHGFQTLFTIVIGAIAYVLFVFGKNKFI